MVKDEDMRTLRIELEVLREQQVQGRLDHDRVWQVHKHVSRLLGRSRGTPYEQTLEVIYSLVDSLWMTKLGQHKMNAAYEQLDR